MRSTPEVLARIPEEAFTLHRLLGFMPGSRAFRHNRGNPLPFEMIVVDEASMVDLPLMAKLLDAVPPEARLLLLGDRDQLASVEPGAVFGDICSVAEAAGWSEAFRETHQAVHAGPCQHSPPNGGGPLQDSMTVLAAELSFWSGLGHWAAKPEYSSWRQRCRHSAAEHERLARCRLGGGRNRCQPRCRVAWNVGSWKPMPAACKRLHLQEAFALFARSRILCAVRQGPFGVAFINQLAEDTLARKGLVRSRGAWYRGRPVMINRNDYQIRLFNGDIGIAWEESAERSLARRRWV